MKKVLSCFLIFVLTFSFFGCSAPEEQNAFPTEITKEPAWQDTQTDVKEPVQQDTQNDVKEPEKVTPLQTEKGEFCPYTIDDYFRPYEIIVVLTKEESKKDKEYTVADFDALEIISVFEYAFSEDNPYGEDRKPLLLMLKNPSKQTVLDYIEILKTDNRVYLATPNLSYPQTSDPFLYVQLNKQLSESIEEEHLRYQEYNEVYHTIPIDWFPEFKDMGITQIEEYTDSSYQYLTILLYFDDKDKTPQQIEDKMLELCHKLSEYDEIVEIRPRYLDADFDRIRVDIKPEYSSKDKEYTKDDFKEISGIKECKTYHKKNYDEVYIYLETKSLYQISRYISVLQKNQKFESVRPATRSILVRY